MLMFTAVFPLTKDLRTAHHHWNHLRIDEKLGDNFKHVQRQTYLTSNLSFLDNT